MFIIVLFTFFFFFFNDTATTEIYTLSLHDALPILHQAGDRPRTHEGIQHAKNDRSEEHTSELQSLAYLVCRLLLEKKKNKKKNNLLQRKKKNKKIKKKIKIIP